jgi:D-alanyl-lipoteichoic acid acyltransferase DltB (MBOAT superfamily)
LSYFKYLHDLVAGIQSLFNADTINLGKIYLPLGISFFTFQLIGYWIDYYLIWFYDLNFLFHLL